MAIKINHVNNTLCSNSGTFVFGTGIDATNTNTIYANNFCASNGKFYGDGSSLTGLATGSFITSSQTGAFGGSNIDLSSYITTGQTGIFVTTDQTGNFAKLDKCQILAKNNTPFNICAVTRVASTYISNQRITDAQGNGAFYFCDHDDASVDDCNLYAINSSYCAAQFSAMILGHAAYSASDIFTTSIKIDGVATCSGVLNQSKIIHNQAFQTEDACVVIENQALKIYVTGAQTGMNWGVRLDIVGMQGYD